MRNAFGFGTEIPIGNQTLAECIEAYAEKSATSESKVIEDYNGKMKVALTKGVEASKARQIDYFLEKAVAVFKQRDIEKDLVFVSIVFSSIFTQMKNVFKQSLF